MKYNWEIDWTTQVRIESGGRYPLGLNRFHDGLEELLIKSFTQTANRLRYISYYCWIVGDIEMSLSEIDYPGFVDEFTRRENALALGLYMMDPNYGVHGKDAMSKIVEESKKDYDCTFKLMQSVDLGAYGLYYAGTIYNWGLIETDEKGIIRLTNSGREIYEILDHYYKKVQPEYYVRYKGKKSVSKEALLEWAKVNDFDKIRQAKHKREREYYKSLLFRLDKKKAADFRRDTLAFVMQCIKDCADNNTLFSADVMRNIYYYSSYYDGNNKVGKINVPKQINDIHFYWLIYEGHLYFRWWMSKYFEVFLQHLKSCDNGSTIEEFFDQIIPENFNSKLKAFCKQDLNYFSESMQAILGLFSKSKGLSDVISEESITFDEQEETFSETLAKFVLIMAGLYVKFKQLRSDKRYQYLIHYLEEDLWFDVLFRYRNLEMIPVSEFLKTILKQHIINQHDLVMIQKNDLRRCWFTTENKRYYHQADVSLIWPDAKYSTIINFLLDLNLIEHNGDNILKLSQEGSIFFKDLMSSYY